MRIRSLIASSATLGALAAPLVTHAAFESIAAVVERACVLVNYLFTGAFILTIVFVLLAAYKYITKGSDPKEISVAHQMLIWAAVGFGIAVLARAVPGLVATILGVSISDAC